MEAVDGFQGREKDVVLVSLMRSNPDPKIGSSMRSGGSTSPPLRAPAGKQSVVGDSGTVTEAGMLEGFVEYASRNAEYVEA